METIEYFSDFLRKIGAPNFLAIGIVMIVLWLLISGFIKGLRKRKQDKESEDRHEHNND
jgi:Na+/H+ antiporter NhaD/arsenite permease-like protein